MGELIVVLAAAAWLVEALTLGYVMGRRGYEAYAWTAIAALLGPIAVVVAVRVLIRPPPREPRLLHGGRRGPGSLDVLVGIDGSAESLAVLDRLASQLRDTVGRVTLARVVTLDAEPESEAAAERQLAAARSTHPELGAATVALPAWRSRRCGTTPPIRRARRRRPR